MIERVTVRRGGRASLSGEEGRDAVWGREAERGTRLPEVARMDLARSGGDAG